MKDPQSIIERYRISSTWTLQLHLSNYSQVNSVGGKSHRDVTGLSVIPPRAERLQQSMQRRLFNPEATDFEMQVHPRPCRCFDSQQDLTPRVGNTALREGWGGGGGRGGRRWEEEVRGNVPSFFSA